MAGRAATRYNPRLDKHDQRTLVVILIKTPPTTQHTSLSIVRDNVIFLVVVLFDWFVGCSWWFYCLG